MSFNRLTLGGCVFWTLFSASVMADNYSWAVSHISPWYVPPEGSPDAGCRKIVETHFPGQTYTITRHSYQVYYCRTYWTGILHGTHVLSRSGNGCPAGAKYNPTTDTCSKDEEKGSPPNACGSSPANSVKYTAGNPINFAAGNKYQQEIDISSPILLQRYYNSLDGIWRHNYSTRLRLAGTEFISFVSADGKELYFSRNGDITTPMSVGSGRVEKTSTGWVYFSRNNETYNFGNDGSLLYQKIGNQEFTLSTQGNVTTITDSFGNTLEIQSTAEGQLAQAKYGNLVITYHYNSDKTLDKVTKKVGGSSQSRSYQYVSMSGINLLKSITNESGIVFAQWEYDESGRAVSSQHAGNTEQVEVIYNPDGSSTVVNEYGKRTNYHYQYINGVNRIIAIDGEPTPDCPASNSTMTYNNKGQMTSHTDAKGNLTTYDYNDRGLETSRTEASGTPQARTVTTEWHPTLFLKSKVTEPDRITNYEYDAQGRQLRQTVIPR